MGEVLSIHPNLRDQTQFRLNKTNKIQGYFITEIREREAISNGFSKCITTFDYFDKALIVLSATSGEIYIASFANGVGALV